MNFADVKSMTIPVNGTGRDVKSISIGGVVVWTKPSAVPYDAILEYVQTPDSATIPVDTGLYVNDTTTSFEIKVNVGPDARPANTGDLRSWAQNATSGTRPSFGFTNSRRTYSLSIQTRTDSYVRGFNNWAPSRGPYVGSYDCTTGNVVLQNLGTTPTTVTGTCTRNNVTFSSTWQLFSTRSGSDVRQVQFYYLKVWQNGTLVRDYIPVRVGQTGVLYDQANPSGGSSGNGLYYPSSGTFTLGPDVPA